MGQVMETRFRLVSCWFVCLFLMVAKCNSLSSTWFWYTITGWLSLTSAFFALITWHISRLNPADSHYPPFLLMQYFVYIMLSFKGRLVFNGFLEKTKRTQETQNKVLWEIIKRNEKTIYGLRNDFSSITSRGDFVKSQPLTRYQDYEDYIRDIRDGKQNILTSDPVVFLSTSSGTTGPSKVIPCTSHMKGQSAMYFGSLMYYFVDQKVQLNLQRAFVLSYKSPTESSLVCTLQKGPISSHMSRYMPFSVSPEDIFQISNEYAALYMHAVFALQEEEVGHIEAINATLVYSFWRFLENNWQDICEDIERGTVPIPLNADRDIVITLQELLKPNKPRADFLRSEFIKGFRGIATRVWPNMRFAKMLTTGTFAIYAKILKDYYMSGVAQISLMHVASEGFMGFNISKDPEDFTYTAAIEYSFMEFIPVERTEDENPNTLFAEELIAGEMYEIVITTPMGLYRYRTGDIIKVLNMCNHCPTYEFCYRAGQILNISWDKTSEMTLYQAMQEATKTLDVTLVDYTATEAVNLAQLTNESNNNNTTKHYVLFVEIETSGAATSGTKRLSDKEKKTFDESLRAISLIYNNLRGNDSIAPMRVIQVHPETFMKLKEITIEQSQNQQYKTPRVIRHPDTLKYLLSSEIDNQLQI